MLRKKIVVIMLTLIMILTQSSILTFAQRTSDQAVDTSFTDLPSSHWANNAVKWMVNKGIISGYPDNTFRPDKVVTRAEFSVIMVRALNIPLKAPESETFADIEKGNWAYSYVESAKYYLTGFRTAQGDKFWPNREAVREDMAVALVKAMNYQNEQVDESILNTFVDKDSISTNLRKYVAIAVKRNIMKGNPVANSELKAFRPQNFLTRAEAAVLIYSTLQATLEEEKITYDEFVSLPATNENSDSLELNEGGSIYNYATPVVQGKVTDGKLILSWTKAYEGNFKYYKVVASKSNPSPRYPQDGYLYVISDRNQTSVMINKNDSYNSGDFGSKLVPGESYYFSVTAVYEDAKVPGNAVLLKYPAQQQVPSQVNGLTGKVENGKIVLNWPTASEYGFTYYKVVISKYDSTPVYPQNGYLCYFTDRSRTTVVIDNKQAYNGGDFGKYLVPGEKYYFSITTVYNDRKVPSNTITLTYPKSTESSSTGTSSQSTFKVTGKVENGTVVLQWTPMSPTGFSYYKVVISKDVSSPRYPEDGYLYYYDNADRTYTVIDNSSPYHGGTFGEYLVPGQKYYFSVTAVYKDRKIVGNAVQLTFPG